MIHSMLGAILVALLVLASPARAVEPKTLQACREHTAWMPHADEFFIICLQEAGVALKGSMPEAPSRRSFDPAAELRSMEREYCRSEGERIAEIAVRNNERSGAMTVGPRLRESWAQQQYFQCLSTGTNFLANQLADQVDTGRTSAVLLRRCMNAALEGRLPRSANVGPIISVRDCVARGG